jgi:hypothetical protein
MKSLFSLLRNSTLGVLMVLGLAVPSSYAAVPAPPGAPYWWNDHNAPFWSYHYNNFSGNNDITEESNNGEFQANLTTQISGNLTQVTLSLRNGYSADLYKHFYIWLTGTSSAAPTFTSLVADNSVVNLPDSLLGLGDNSSGLGISYVGNIWQLSYGATATPQPDFVILKFDLPAGSTITQWAAGEQCLPVPEPTAISILALFGGLSLLGRRRN